MSHEYKKKAVALSYDSQKDAAPRVIAKGKGLVAETLIDVAKQHKIPIQEDPSLVELLQQIQINDKIPEELYGVVAELFAFIYKLDQQVGLKDKT